MLTETFMSGAICMGFLIITLYFLRFWKRTRDRLFLFFAAGFALQLVERLIRAAAEPASANSPGLYLIRLLAFATLIAAIIDKNRRCGSGGGTAPSR